MVNDFSWVDEFCCSDRIVHRDRSGTFINTEWRAFQSGSILNQDWHWPSSLSAWLLCLPKSIITVINSQSARRQNVNVNWLWRAHAEFCWRHWTSSKNQHPSLCCLCYQFSIMVKLKLSRFPLKHFASLVMWLFCDLNENIHVSHRSRNWLKEEWKCLLRCE